MKLKLVVSKIKICNNTKDQNTNLNLIILTQKEVQSLEILLFC